MPPCRSELVNKINWFFDLNNLYHWLEASKIKNTTTFIRNSKIL